MTDRLFLLGPTASGKTAVALTLAKELNAEILSLDSMLVYRHMNIGTAKPTPAECAIVPHHLLDLVEPHETCSVALWLAAADRAEAEVRARGKRPLYVGGTGLYLRARTAGLHQGPDIPQKLRVQVEAELHSGGRANLRQELQEGDPSLHDRLHENDDKRLLRGIEVLRATGRRLSAWQREWQDPVRVGAPAVALVHDRAQVHARIEARFDAMLEAGLLNEIRQILQGGGFSRASRQALGYRQMLAHLEDGLPLDQARDKAIHLTRRLVRRQSTWLRRFLDLRVLSVVEGQSTSELTQVAAQMLAGKIEENPPPRRRSLTQHD